MRRVVVTGLGMVSPIACGVEATWRRLLASESGAARVENFDVSDLPCQIAAQVPRGGAPDAFNPDDWMDPKEQRRVDDFIIYGMSAATQALRDADWEPKTYEEQIETGVLIGSGIGGLGGIYDASITLHEKGPRRISPFFIPGQAHQSGERAGFDRPQSQGPQPRGGHRLLDRRACDRRRGAADRPWRRQRDGRRRRGIGGEPPFAGRLLRLPRPVDRLQRPAEAGLAPLRSRSRRFRHGRRRRMRGARGDSSMPRHAALGSTPNWSAMAFQATPITSPRPRPMATALFAP